MISHDELSIVNVDPRNIVNEYGVRPVLARDIEIILQGFTSNGYDSSVLISCRKASAPEIEQFLKRKFSYSSEKAADVTRSVLKEKN